MSVTREQLVEAARAAVELERRRKARPLRYERLWDSPQTSQRRAFQEGLAGGGVQGLLLLGGNGTGKTRAAADFALMMAQGGDHPDVVAFCVANGLDAAQIPKGPGVVWVASETFGAAKEQIRPHLLALAPEGTRVRHWSMDKQAEMILPEGGRIISKAYEQYKARPQTWEGAQIRAVVFDEEPVSALCMAAAFARTRSLRPRPGQDADQRWFWMCAVTLLNGEDWFWETYVKEPRPEVLVRYLHQEDNPHLDQVQAAAAVAAAPKWQQEARKHGVVTMPVGRRLPVFSRSVHVVPHVEPPSSHLRWAGVDWGSYAPNAVWVAEDPKTAALYVYREHAPRREREQPPITDGEFIEQCKDIEGRDLGRVAWRVADSADQGAIQEAARRGWVCIGADKGAASIEDGLDEIAAFLATTYQDQPRPPRLFVSERCPSLIKELEQLKWLPAKAGVKPATDPTCADHGVDGLRYILLLRRKMGRP